MYSVRVVLFGCGGYAVNYVKALLPIRSDLVLVGVVDPCEGTSVERLRSMGVPVYADADGFFSQVRADLAIISSPIRFHEPQTVRCLKEGCHVLVEKPIAATPEAARRMMDARGDRLLSVGFQWCFDPTMLRFKQDADAGRFGRLLSMRAAVIWPRDLAYYARGGGWAGKRYDRDDAPIFDSVLSNATAHYLMNMLWVAGTGYTGSALTDLAGETYRANEIETYDTVCLRGTLAGGASLFYLASHATGASEIQNPLFEYVYEGATVRFGSLGGSGSRIIATLTDGTNVDYGVTDTGNLEKLSTCVQAVREGRTDTPCPPEAALRHAEVIAELRRICPDAARFPNTQVDPNRRWVPGLYDRLLRLYESRALLSEIERA